MDQLPEPSVGAVGLEPLASQVMASTSEISLRVTVIGLPVVLLNMKANSSKEFAEPSSGMTGLVNTRCVTLLTPLTPFIASPALGKVELLVPRLMPVTAAF